MGLKSDAEGEEGAPARDAEGRRPSEPGMTLDWSERLMGGVSEIFNFRENGEETYMSPNKFSVSMTPFNFFGFATIIIDAESTS